MSVTVNACKRQGQEGNGMLCLSLAFPDEQASDPAAYQFLDGAYLFDFRQRRQIERALDRRKSQ
jgi:hypothetical protein